ncbi:MAG: glutamate--tRNA ligase [Candidatus Shikimatogenerans bostrichidophilus]|nr:MAG: glutamate--tRNA ligase [Candidatus Shikimatogenerans bostrichidophilus]
MKEKIRVRFAPSPTGPLHIGSLRTAFFNYLFAKKNNGKFILRIDDTDKKRYIKKSINYILDTFKWCNIKYNEGYNKKGKYGPYIQSKRLKIYKKYLKYLIKKKFVYYAYDNKKDILLYKKKNKNFLYNSINREKLNNSINKKNKKIKKKFVIRLKTPKNKNIIFNDKIYGKIKINTNELDDKIIFRSNNTPTYHFANVIDDHLMKITHVIRGKEWIYSTPIQIILYNYLKWKIPNFIHLPLILNKKKGKISKRFYKKKKNNLIIYPIKSKYKSIKINNSFEENGYLPESLLNIIFLLGYKNINKYEILNLKQMIKLFSIKNINKSNIYFNYKKASWINKKHIEKNKKILKNIIYLKLKKKIKKKFNKKILKKIVNSIFNRLYFINIKNIWNVCYYFFKKPKKYIFNKKLKKTIINNKKKIIKFFLKIFFLFKKIKKNIYIKKFFNKLSLKNKKNFFFKLKILRLSIIGSLKGIEIIKIINFIKKKEIIKRIKYFIKNNKLLFTNTKFRKNII